MTIDVPKELESFVQQAVASGKFGSPEEVVSEALRLLKQQQQATPRDRREGGQWRGRVKIAKDFDELPDDLANSFGMKEV